MADASTILLKLCNAVGLLTHDGDENTAGGILNINWFAKIESNINIRLFGKEEEGAEGCGEPGEGWPYLFDAVCNAIDATAGSPASDKLNADWYKIAGNETLYLVVPESSSDTDQSSSNPAPSRYGLGAQMSKGTWGTAVLAWLLDLNKVSTFAPTLDAEVWATFSNFMLSKVTVGVLHNQDKDGNVTSYDTAILSIKAFLPASAKPDYFMEHTVDLLNGETIDYQILAALLAKSFIRFESSGNSSWALLLTNHLLPLLGSQKDGANTSTKRSITKLFPWVFDDEKDWQVGASPSSSVADWLSQLLPTKQDNSVNAAALAEFIWHLKCLITGEESRSECTGSKIVIANDGAEGQIGFRAAADSTSLTIGICEPKDNPSYSVNLIRFTLEANSVAAKLIWEGSCPPGTFIFGNGATLKIMDGELTIGLEPGQNGFRLGGKFLRSGGSDLTLTMVLNELKLGCTIGPTGLTTTASNPVSMSNLCSWLAALIPTQADQALSKVATCIQVVLSKLSNTSGFVGACFANCKIPLPSGAGTLTLGDGSELSMEKNSSLPTLTLKNPGFSIHGAHGYPLRGITVAVHDTVVIDAGGLGLGSKASYLSMEVTLTDLQLPFGTGSGLNLEQGLLSGIATENPPVTLTLLRDSKGNWSLDKLDALPILIDRQVGPLYVEQLKVGVEEHSLQVGVDGHFSMAGLEIVPQGLALTAENLLTLAPPVFGASLEGLAISFQGDAMEMSGLFRKEGKDYQGAALIRVAEWQLSAVGAYTMLGDAPSMFVFGGVRTPLGGTPDFFVTGAAGGFGYNRRLKLPGVHQLHEHPFLQVMEGDLALGDVSSGINKYFPAERGAYWFAGGISFISYGFINGIGLFYARWGEDSGFGLLATASIDLPTPEYPYLVHLGIVINVDVNLGDDPYLLASGGLSDDSNMLGGMYSVHGQWALQTWLSNGETVMTAGGYSANYAKPAKYPDVARIGFEQDLIVFYSSGELYFALTPDKAMIGGSYRAGLDYSWVGGELSFDLDCVMNWDPFWFIATARVVGSLWVDVYYDEWEVGVGVDATIWGPSLGGRISIDLEVATLELPFGDPNPPDQIHTLSIGAWIERQLHLPWTDKNGPIVVSGAPDPDRDQAGAFQLQVMKGRVPSLEDRGDVQAAKMAQNALRVGTNFVLKFTTLMPLIGDKTIRIGKSDKYEELTLSEGVIHVASSCLAQTGDTILSSCLYIGGNLINSGTPDAIGTSGQFPRALYGNIAETPTAPFNHGFYLIFNDTLQPDPADNKPFNLPNHDGIASSADWGPEPFPKKLDFNLHAIMSTIKPDWDMQTILAADYTNLMAPSPGAGGIAAHESGVTNAPDSSWCPSSKPHLYSVSGTSGTSIYIQSCSQVPVKVRPRGRSTRRTSRPSSTQRLFRGAPVVNAPTAAPGNQIPGLTLRFFDLAARAEVNVPRLHRRTKPLSAGRALDTYAAQLASSSKTEALHLTAGQALVSGLAGSAVSELNPIQLNVVSGTQMLRVLALGRYDTPLADIKLSPGTRTLPLPPRTHRLLLLGLGQASIGIAQTASGFDGESSLMRLGQTGFAGAGCVVRVEEGSLPEHLSDGPVVARRLLAKLRRVRVHFTSPVPKGSLVLLFRAMQNAQSSLAEALELKAVGASLGAARFVQQQERVAAILPLEAAPIWWVRLAWLNDFQLLAAVSRLESSDFMIGLLSTEPLWELIDDGLESGSGYTTLKLEAGVRP